MNNMNNKYPEHWINFPTIQTCDIKQLPYNFGQGSTSELVWIKSNIEKDFKQFESMYFKDMFLKYSQNKIVDHLSNENPYISREKCILLYTPAVKELLSFPKCDNGHELLVDYITDEDDSYIEVKQINPDFIKDPPKNLKQWGGKENDEFDCPDGYYNINWYGYQKFYAITGIERNKYAYSKIKLTDRLKNHVIDFELIIAEIILVLTYEGILEKDSKLFWDNIKNLKYK